MAVAVDEFGSAIGIITMEDILEEVVGEIDVGYDFDEYTPKKRHRLEEIEDDVYVMDSRVPISEANLGSSRPARRPAYSALDNSVLCDMGWEPMRHHRDAIAAAVADLTGTGA